MLMVILLSSFIYIVLCREDVDVDDLIDAIEGNRKYVECLYVYNKIDAISLEEVNHLARIP